MKNHGLQVGVNEQLLSIRVKVIDHIIHGKAIVDVIERNMNTHWKEIGSELLKFCEANR